MGLAMDLFLVKMRHQVRLNEFQHLLKKTPMDKWDDLEEFRQRLVQESWEDEKQTMEKHDGNG